jgi:hypothetical protein
MAPIALTPTRLLQHTLLAAELVTAAKSFEANSILADQRLNRWGLHVARVRVAQHIAGLRRLVLAGALRPEDRAAYRRDGVVVRRDFLPRAQFEQLTRELRAYAGKARAKREGGTLMRKFAVDGDFCAQNPSARAFLQSRELRALVAYVGAQSSEPLIDLQTLERGADGSDVDPQTLLHADTFHPTAKAWLFLADVEPDEGPFCYVLGSHRLTPARLAFERAQCQLAARSPIRDVREGSFRVSAEQLAAMGLPPPTQLAVPANTLVVADTFGFHARGPALRPCKRVEFRVLGRRSPFLPYRLDRSIQRLAQADRVEPAGPAEQPPLSATHEQPGLPPA